MELRIGERISEELRMYIDTAWNDKEFKQKIESATGYSTTSIRDLINGRAKITEGNSSVIIEATRLAIKEYKRNADLLQRYANELKNVKIIKQ